MFVFVRSGSAVRSRHTSLVPEVIHPLLRLFTQALGASWRSAEGAWVWRGIGA